MKLMIFYQHSDSKGLSYRCRDIARQDDSVRVVDDYIRSLRRWKNSICTSLTKDSDMSASSFVATYRQSKKDVRDAHKRKKIRVEFHVRDDKQMMISREAFCLFIDTLLKDQSRSGRQLIKSLVKSPHTSDLEVDYIMEILFKGVQQSQKRPAH